jgi:hypothetical protein
MSAPRFAQRIEPEEPTLEADQPRAAYVPGNVLAIPLAHVVMDAYTNEDWVDSLVYYVTNSDGQPIAQMDLRGTIFEVMLRRRAPDNEVILGGSSLTGTLTVGVAPNWGHLIFYFSRRLMGRLWPGQYVGDVIARDDRFERTVLTIDLTVIQGISRGGPRP